MDALAATTEVMPSKGEPNLSQQQQQPPSGTTAEQGQVATQSEGKPLKRRRSFKGKRGNGKIHIRLPTIEAYQKEICFAAEAPGRVVVRLERIMGSDKIRPVDGSYMKTLIQRLEEEEALAWTRKIRLRKKAERERYRQLAIAGLMEPGPGMEDLYNHPVFRVNRILNRLSKMDHRFAGNLFKTMPPIENVDPFEDDDTGAFFKKYPYHRELRRQWEKYRDKTSNQPTEFSVDIDDLLSSKYQSYAEFVATVAATRRASRAVAPSAETEDEDEEEKDEELEIDDNTPAPSQPPSVAQMQDDTWVGPGEGVTEIDQLAMQLDRELTMSLASLQNQYGVPASSDFEHLWKVHRSDLVEKLFSDFDTLHEIYDASGELFELFTRQVIMANEHVKQHQFIAAGTTGEVEETGDEGDDEEEEDEGDVAPGDLLETIKEEYEPPALADPQSEPAPEPEPAAEPPEGETEVEDM